MRLRIEKDRLRHPATQLALGERIPGVNTDSGFYAHQRRDDITAAFQARRREIFAITHGPSQIAHGPQRDEAITAANATYMGAVVDALLAEANGMAINHPHSQVAQNAPLLTRIQTITNQYIADSHSATAATKTNARKTKDTATEALLNSLNGAEKAGAKALLEDPHGGISRRAVVVGGAVTFLAACCGLSDVVASRFLNSHQGQQNINPSTEQPTATESSTGVLQYSDIVNLPDGAAMAGKLGGNPDAWKNRGNGVWTYDDISTPIASLQIAHGAEVTVNGDFTDGRPREEVVVVGGEQGTILPSNFGALSVVMRPTPSDDISREAGNGQIAKGDGHGGHGEFQPYNGSIPSN